MLKVNYNECITNLSCSIRKYFGLDYKHSTLEYIDKIFNDKKPENVVVMLFDGMGSRILNRTLKKDDFFIKKIYKEITSVFPSTTTAATTSFLTGLNPIEHGWLGWNMYIKPIDKTITLFLNSEKGKEEVCEDFLQIKSKLKIDNIIDEINNKENLYALSLMPFGDQKYNNLDEMLNLIEKETVKKGKKFIYAYDDEPDSTMHDYGPDSKEVSLLIKERNRKVEKFCKNLKNTLVLIIADHGQMKVENIHLEDYPAIFDMLERTTSIENRAISFKIKENKKRQFEEIFNKNFGEYFDLYNKQQVINNNLFGAGTPNELFEDAIGDFIAVASESSKAILTSGSSELCSMHGGNSDDEVYVPLIIIDKC